ncbi:MAG: alpha/beta hydrolase [Ruminococcaceae bacterium]|nr:alpha/beta hydrolase [Oscillospiraceae bacterium]
MKIKSAEYVYKKTPERDLMLRILSPTVRKYEKAPVFLTISGGGWHMESIDSILGMYSIATERLLSEGFVVASMDYRVTSQQDGCIGNIIGDCFEAIIYLKEHETMLGIDADRIAVSGHSAGGHLALMLAYAPTEQFTGKKADFTIRCVSALSPPTILYQQDVPTTLAFDTSALFHSDERENEARIASPITYAKKACPPTLLIAGTSDRLVYSNSSELLYDKLRSAGAPCELILSICGGHCFEAIHDLYAPSLSMEKAQQLCAEFVLQNT